MPKNVVFFADGTGNDRAHGFKTNVAKLSDDAENMRVSAGGPTWQDLSGPALDAEVDRPDIRQITSYDAGVGTEMGDLIGRPTGSGISQTSRMATTLSFASTHLATASSCLGLAVVRTRCGALLA